MPNRNAKKIIIHKGTVMISASWVLMRIREMKARSNSEYWNGHNLAVLNMSRIIRKETHRVKWNARKNEQGT